MPATSVTESENDRYVQALDLVMRLRKVSESELARRVDLKPQRINDRHTGKVPLRAGELATYAKAMGVPPELLARDIAGILAWFVEHPEMATDPYAAGDSNPEPADSVPGQLELTAA